MWVRKKTKVRGGARWTDSFGFQTFQRLPQVFICRQAESQEEEFLSLCVRSLGVGWGGAGADAQKGCGAEAAMAACTHEKA